MKNCAKNAKNTTFSRILNRTSWCRWQEMINPNDVPKQTEHTGQTPNGEPSPKGWWEQTSPPEQ